MAEDNFSDAPPERPTSLLDDLTGGFSSALQDSIVRGLTLGGSDHAAALGGSVVDFLMSDKTFIEAYKQNLADVRGVADKQKKDFPITTGVSEFVSSIAGPAKVAEGLTAGLKFAQMPVAGALFGGVEAGLKGENVVGGAATGAVAGTLGPVIRGVAKAGSGTLRATSNVIGNLFKKRAGKLARKKINQAVEEMAARNKKTAADLGGKFEVIGGGTPSAIKGSKGAALVDEETIGNATKVVKGIWNRHPEILEIVAASGGFAGLQFLTGNLDSSSAAQIAVGAATVFSGRGRGRGPIASVFDRTAMVAALKALPDYTQDDVNSFLDLLARVPDDVLGFDSKKKTIVDTFSDSGDATQDTFSDVKPAGAKTPKTK